MIGDRAHLIKTLEDRFVPLVIEHGFRRFPLAGRDQASKEMHVAFPLGYMKRADGANLQLLEIQFEKRGRAEFVINIGVAQPDGVTLPWGHFLQNEVGVSGLAEAYRLYSRPSWMKWFSLAWFPTDRDARAAKLVSRLISLYPEIEGWFAARSVGPHLRRFSL